MLASQLTDTGLDDLVRLIETDEGLKRAISASDLAGGANAASELNALVVEGIRELGVANDGTFDGADLRALGDWAQADAARYKTFVALYGTSQNGVETGFQLVEQDDSSSRIFGEDAVDEVADAIYSFGFGTRGDQILNDKGELYRSVALTASWVDELLTDADMKALSNPNGSTVVEGTTGTGLDELVEVVKTDPGLIESISRQDIADGAKAVDAMNHMFLDGIRALGLAKDGSIDRSDVTAISDWIQGDANREGDFLELYGDFNLVLNQGAEIAYIGVDDDIHPHVGHVINHGMRGIYQLGFGTETGRVINDDGNPDISTAVPASWFDQLLTDADMNALSNTSVDVNIKGTTGTGLDKLVDIINADPGLTRNVSRSEIAAGARSADALNNVIVDTIETLGLGKDGGISNVDVQKISNYIRADDARHDEFTLLRGSSENGVETGFHLVLDDGGTTRLFDKWAINNVADAIYHIGFETETNLFLDEDGDPSYSVARVAQWIDDLMFG